MTHGQRRPGSRKCTPFFVRSFAKKRYISPAELHRLAKKNHSTPQAPQPNWEMLDPLAPGRQGLHLPLWGKGRYGQTGDRVFPVPPERGRVLRLAMIWHTPAPRFNCIWLSVFFSIPGMAIFLGGKWWMNGRLAAFWERASCFPSPPPDLLPMQVAA